MNSCDATSVVPSARVTRGEFTSNVPLTPSCASSVAKFASTTTMLFTAELAGTDTGTR